MDNRVADLALLGRERGCERSNRHVTSMASRDQKRASVFESVGGHYFEMMSANRTSPLFLDYTSTYARSHVLTELVWWRLTLSIHSMLCWRM